MLPTGSTSIVILPSSEIYWGWEACSVEAGLSWDWFCSRPWSKSRWSFAHRNTHLWSRRLYIHWDNKSTVCRKKQAHRINHVLVFMICRLTCSNDGILHQLSGDWTQELIWGLWIALLCLQSLNFPHETTTKAHRHWETNTLLFSTTGKSHKPIHKIYPTIIH